MKTLLATLGSGLLVLASSDGVRSGGADPCSCLTPEQRAILTHLSLVSLEDGQGGRASTIRISKANLQLVNGLGATNGNPDDPVTTEPGQVRTNGLGNLIVGYLEPSPFATLPRTGSHNVVVGGRHSYTSYGGAVLGQTNGIWAPLAAVTGGTLNNAYGVGSTVSGGEGNRADGDHSAVGGGRTNNAEGAHSSIPAGLGGSASGAWSTVCGGAINQATGPRSSVVGGGVRQGDRRLQLGRRRSVRVCDRSVQPGGGRGGMRGERQRERRHRRDEERRRGPPRGRGGGGEQSHGGQHGLGLRRAWKPRRRRLVRRLRRRPEHGLRFSSRSPRAARSTRRCGSPPASPAEPATWPTVRAPPCPAARTTVRADRRAR